jgi:hypothetical protein
MWCGFRMFLHADCRFSRVRHLERPANHVADSFWLLDQHAIGDPKHPPTGELRVVVAEAVTLERFESCVPRSPVDLDN